MGLFKLRFDDSIDHGVLVNTQREKIDYEESFENWLENSPNFLFSDEGNTVLWIGRQASAKVGDTDKYPDLIGVDSFGDLIIVELKKGKTPREVIAQILEYNCWASNLKYDDLNQIYLNYSKNSLKKNLLDAYNEIFSFDDIVNKDIEFNRNQKLFIIAEEISSTVHEVSSFLRQKYKIDLSCLEYKVLKASNSEYIISTERVVGFDNFQESAIVNTVWNEPIKVKKVVENAVYKFTLKNQDKVFTPRDIYSEIVKEYPKFKRNTLNCQIIADCVNHTSRKHYPSGQQDLYYRIADGQYRLYNKDCDGYWDSEGKRVS